MRRYELSLMVSEINHPELKWVFPVEFGFDSLTAAKNRASRIVDWAERDLNGATQPKQGEDCCVVIEILPA